jgi:YfiH family protein
VAGVRAGYSLRQGGVSGPPWNSFNLGDHVGDDPAAVAANRQRLTQTLGVRPVFLRQVHGWGVRALPCADNTEVDGVWAEQAGTACCIMVADCLPILLSDAQGQVVAAAHAGWRGLCGQQGTGVLESLLGQLRQRHPQASWLAWLGPAIGPLAYEVGDDVRQAFVATRADAERHFHPIKGHTGKWWCDLPRLAHDRLHSLGVTQIGGNDGSEAWCTHTRADLYFSHRRDGRSGRMAAAIFLHR